MHVGPFQCLPHCFTEITPHPCGGNPLPFSSSRPNASHVYGGQEHNTGSLPACIGGASAALSPRLASRAVVVSSRILADDHLVAAFSCGNLHYVCHLWRRRVLVELMAAN